MSHSWHPAGNQNEAELEPGMNHKELVTPIVITARKLTRRKIMQDILRALGRYYEHQREDRDHYIRIFWENIVPGEKFKDKLLPYKHLVAYTCMNKYMLERAKVPCVKHLLCIYGVFCLYYLLSLLRLHQTYQDLNPVVIKCMI